MAKILKWKAEQRLPRVGNGARGGEGEKGEVLAGRERISVLVVMDTCDKTVQNTSRCVQDCTHTCSIV